MSEDRAELLVEARNRAEKLLADLRDRLADLTGNRLARLPEDDIEAGLLALRRAIDCTEHTIAALDRAIARKPSPGQ